MHRIDALRIVDVAAGRPWGCQQRDRKGSAQQGQ